MAKNVGLGTIFWSLRWGGKVIVLLLGSERGIYFTVWWRGAYFLEARDSINTVTPGLMINGYDEVYIKTPNWVEFMTVFYNILNYISKVRQCFFFAVQKKSGREIALFCFAVLFFSRAKSIFHAHFFSNLSGFFTGKSFLKAANSWFFSSFAREN